MKRLLIGLLCLIIMGLVSACGNTDDTDIPTLAVLPTAMPTATPLPTRIMRQVGGDLPPTWTFTPTATATMTPSETGTSLPSWTPLPTDTATATLTATPESDAFVSNEQGVNVRTGPSTRFNPPLETLDQGDLINMVAVSTDGTWYEVETASGQIGWVFGEMITLNRDMPNLEQKFIETPTASPEPLVLVNNNSGQPVVLGVDGSASTTNTTTNTNTTSSVNVVTGSGSGSIANVVSISSRTRQIYQSGLSRGNNPRVFVKVGDSITNNQPFLNGYGSGEYNLGTYGYLQDSINYFDNSAFTRNSIAAESGFNAAAVRDPIWSPPNCLANESPLNCEYRTMKPSLAIIMYGSLDVQLYGADAFRGYLNQVVQDTISQGIVPVLTTFPNGADYYPSQCEEFNNVIRSIATAEQIPLIEFRNPALGLPDRGVGSDKFHLSLNGTSYYIALNGEQNQFGLTLRNMLTLQALDDLRRGLGMG